MPARCIECKGNFNRATSEDKLRCPSCQEPEEKKPEWKRKLKKLKETK